MTQPEIAVADESAVRHTGHSPPCETTNRPDSLISVVRVQQPQWVLEFVECERPRFVVGEQRRSGSRNTS